jgi:NAD-specific glutamate dehydrogenase
MRQYKVRMMLSECFYQDVLVYADSEDEAYDLAHSKELDDSCWTSYKDRHVQAEAVYELAEIVLCDLSEATHVLVNGNIHELDGQEMTKWIEHGQTLGIKILKPLLGGLTYTCIDKENFALLGIKPTLIA